ncbi:hypothetical protein BDF19DRAFT_71933 [Syncephalis fuscata]|nr:hypothetical protein BDF19DRAFT_71933 [Syncephalis fuscata]
MTTTLPLAESLVKIANESAQPAPWLCPARIVKTRKNQIAVYSIKADQLRDVEKKWIYQLVEKNMRAIYTTASWDWDKEEKRAELFHKDSRFIIAQSNSSDDSLKPVDNEQFNKVIRQWLAFAMFRFDTEEQMASDDMIPVLYCYELQVDCSAQGQGIGRILMQEMDKIAAHWHMTKIMLTLIKINTPAKLFYQQLGFTIDEISPENILPMYRVKRISYQILSKCPDTNTDRTLIAE